MSMQFVHTEAPQGVVDAVKACVAGALQTARPVALFVSGGSLIPLEVTIIHDLVAHESAANLTIMQVDERYGDIGHADSNWQKLLDAGLNPKNVKCVPILRGQSLQQTVDNYTIELTALDVINTIKIGMFGIGADGHTAGILPHSEAAQSSKKLVSGYAGPDFTRITIMPAMIASLDVAIAYAHGADKTPALARLQQDIAGVEQPAQFLKRAKQTVVYTDYKEGVV